MKSKNYLTPNEVADILMVSPVTVRQWAQKGMLNALTTPGGHRRYTKQHVELFARKHGISILPPARDYLHILIIDDDAQLARYIHEVLSIHPDNIKLLTASNGFEAGRQIQTFKPDVVLLDLMMPSLDGFSVCRILKEDPSTSSIRIIAMTGYYTPDNVEQIVNAGAETCLAKPLQLDALFDAIGITAPLHID